jgi:transcriptional regulator with GAF, ATPase, and Fis domain
MLGTHTTPSSTALRILVRQRDTLIRVIPLPEGEITIGRGPENNLVLEDALVSRRHCRLRPQGGTLWLEDLDSANGIFLNGQPADRAPIVPGDLVEVGPFSITLEVAHSSGFLRAETAPATQVGTPQRDAPPAARELSVVLSVLEALDALTPSDAVLDRLLASLLAVLKGERAFLYRYDVHRRSLGCVRSHFASGADQDQPVSETLLHKVAQARESYLMTDLVERAGNELSSVQRLVEARVQSIIVVPLTRGRKLTGILYVDSIAARRHFSTADLDLLNQTAGYLAQIVDSLQVQEELIEENRRLKDAVAGGAGAEHVPLDKLVAEGSPMRPVIDLVNRAASREVTVLLSGETGTGKEVVARSIHRLSTRRSSRFVAINCGAVPESLVESELFGYRKGAFSGAEEDRAGLIELANEGTLFLDEVGELPLAVQVKLLRVLEERQVQRLGASEPVPVSFRLIAASHRDLAALVATGQFRQDLLYRLRVFPIELPPLRERLADLPLVVDYMIGHLAPRLDSSVRAASSDLVAALGRYSWPGNLRELRNALERALVVEETEELTVRSLPLEIRSPKDQTPRTAGTPERGGGPVIPVLVEGAGAMRRWADVLKELERAYMRKLMSICGQNISAMARMSGISRLTLYRKLGQLGLEAPPADPETLGDEE